MGTAAAPATNLQAITIDRNSRVPFYVQLYEAVRVGVQDGTFAPGQRLPAIQELAAGLDISRSTIKRAFQKLGDEGLVTGTAQTGFLVAGVGTSAPTPVAAPNRPATPPVASAAAPAPVFTPSVKIATAPPIIEPFIPEPPVAMPEVPAVNERRITSDNTFNAERVAMAAPATPIVAPEQAPVIAEPRTISFNRLSILDQIDFSRLHVSGAPRPFRPGFPETREFPLEMWEGLRTQLLKQRTAELLDFCGTFGYLPLRESIATRLRNARGVRCSAEQVIVTAGAQQALNLVINTLISPGDAVGMEEPGYYGVKAAFLQAGARIQPLLVDEEGLTVPSARRQNPPSMIYTTPPNQFPLGAKLSLQRRLSLLEFARQTNTWIIEDDSDGDFSYSGRPLPSLQSADDQNRVIYLGTTGKTLFPSLEIGYVVAPLSLMESFSKTKEIMGGQPCVIDQATLARFLSDGHFDRHLHRMNLIYYQRLQALAESVDSELGDFIDLEPATGGLHAIGWLKRGLEEEVVRNCAVGAGIELPLLSSYGRTALVRPGVVFGFASFTEKKIRQTVRKLAGALRSPQNYKAPSYKALPPPSAMQKSGLLQKLFHRGV